MCLPNAGFITFQVKITYFKDLKTSFFHATFFIKLCSLAANKIRWKISVNATILSFHVNKIIIKYTPKILH